MNIPSIRSFGTNKLFVLVSMVFAIAFTAAFASAQAVNHDQCANGDFGTPIQACSYQNGNLNRENSQWIEGEFVSHKVVITPAGGSSVKISFDSTEGGDHAYDYLGTYTTSQTLAEGNVVCTGTCTGPITIQIPLDANVAAGGVTQIGGQFFTIFNASAASVVAHTAATCDPADPAFGPQADPNYCLKGTYAGTSETSIIINFTRIGTNDVVIAWGGHISTRADWGANNSAINIGGSPYHMRVNDGTDRSLKVEDFTFPARVTIVKEVSAFNTGGVSEKIFSFTATNAPVSFTPNPFTLQDNGSDADGTPDRREFVLPLDAATTTFTVTEQAPGGGWSVSNINCVETDGGNLQGVDDSTGSAALPYAGGNTGTLKVQRSELITCTWTNVLGQPTAAKVTVSGRTVSSNGRALSGVTVTLTNAQTGERKTATTNTFGSFTFTEVEVENFYTLSAVKKGYKFDPLSFPLEDELTGIVLIANK